MAQSPTVEKKGVNWISVIIGAALCVAGFYVSSKDPFHWKPALDSLAAQGIPLDPGITVSAIGAFLMLFPLFRMFYFNPLDEAIFNRTSELENTFSEAEGLRSEITTMRSEYEARLAKTEAEARETIQAQVREAQELGQQLRAEAAAQAEEMKRNATNEIAAERDKVMRELQLSVVNLTMQATEKLLGENVDTEKNRKLVEEFITQVEAPR